MTDRYFVDTPIRGEEIVLAGPEAHHLIHVMRAAKGSKVVLFDGTGWEFVGRVESLNRNAAMVRVEERLEANREVPGHITIATALPRGDRQRWLVEKLTEIGVHRLLPVHFRRSVAEATPSSIARLRRTVVEASKQCGRNRLMEIASPSKAGEFFALQTPAFRLLADPAGMSWSHIGASWQARPRDMIIAIGPEGGLSDEEQRQATRAGWTRVALGSRTLRLETAAIALAVMACCEDPDSHASEGAKTA